MEEASCSLDWPLLCLLHVSPLLVFAKTNSREASKFQTPCSVTLGKSFNSLSASLSLLGGW